MNSLMTFFCVLLAACISYVVCVPVDTSDKGMRVAEQESPAKDLVKRDWSGMKAAWGKRAGDDDVENWDVVEVPQRQIRGPNGWQKGLGAWGKRAGDWGQNLRAWGKRTPQEWNSEYMQTLQRQMEAVKNRRASNWQLASWGKRR